MGGHGPEERHGGRQDGRVRRPRPRLSRSELRSNREDDRYGAGKESEGSSHGHW